MKGQIFQVRYGLALLGLVVCLSLGACSAMPAESTPTPDPEAELSFESVVSATGKVVPVQWATLSLAANGIVQSVDASEGQQLPAGQVILRLDGVEAMEAAVTTAQMELLSAQQDLDTLQEDAEQVRAQAQLNMVMAQDAFDDAKEKRESKTFERTDSETVDIARANLIIAEDGVTQAEINYDRFDSLGQDNPMRAEAFSQLAAARKVRDTAQANLNWVLGKPDAQEIAEADARLEVARANLDVAQLNWERVKDGPDPRTLALAQARLKNAQAQVEAANAALSDLTLAAPYAGVTSKLYVRSNEWVTAGQPVAMFADLSDLKVETTDLSEIDVARLQVGNHAEVTFDALPDVNVGGTVSSIATMSDEGSGVNYTVMIDLDEIPAGLRWGMTAFVDITLQGE
ncbi:MAG: efflux RND transporter periplasmic adaptor subunit [Anaerolineaceae bacterium]|nr:efflux RND transporter periplasmic adaptor subunit [Anaerolineaceae bacterium]